MLIRRVWPATPFYRASLPDPMQVRRDMDRLFEGFSGRAFLRAIWDSCCPFSTKSR